MSNLYVATVQLLVEAADRDGAADGISELLQDSDFMVDWAYFKLGAQRLFPDRRMYLRREGYKEGDFLL